MFLIQSGVKNEMILLPWLFNFILERVTRRAQDNQGGLKLNGLY
jgi:hypothetical protein